MFLLQANSDISVDNIWITIATILFALSLIAERIANLIKLQKPSLRDETDNKIEEKKREKKIMWLAVISGIIVSVIAGADFFTLINEGKLIYLEEINTEKLPLVKTLGGLFLSGLFISMGSKFWHDMLDIVLQLSNLKKYKTEEQQLAMKQQKIETFRTEQVFLIEQIENIKPRLQQMPGYTGFNIKATSNYDQIIDIEFENSGPAADDKTFLQDYFGNKTLMIKSNVPKNNIK